MLKNKLESVARSLVAPGKGILAADESFPTIEKRFKSIEVVSTKEHRCEYREMLFMTPGLAEHISGVILFDETIRQTGSNGHPFPVMLMEKGLIPGIKVDKGTVSMAGFAGEKITEGLDGLRQRLVEYQTMGAAFAKWRAVITIGEGLPTSTCINSNMEALARFASLCQEAALVPIVEPEVLMDGAHTIERCEEVTAQTLKSLFAALQDHCVFLEGTLLKPNMVLAGKACPERATVPQVAEATLRCLRRTVPAALPGIVFLSGGQSPAQATEHLNAMNDMDPQPWELSFSYGRALQEPALAAWKGSTSNVKLAQEVLCYRALCNGAARLGNYSPQLEGKAPG